MRSTYLKVDTKKIIKNLSKLRSKAGDAKIIPIVKANAYGLGLKPIAHLLRKNGAEYLGVAYPSEAATLRDSGDLENIIVIVPPCEDDAKHLIDFDLEFVIDDIARLEAMHELALKKKYVFKCHVFINTGMNRDGIANTELLPFLKRAKALSNVYLKGICSQYTESESEDSLLSKKQKELFDEAVGIFEDFYGKKPEMVHLSNTGGTVNYPSDGLTHNRCGIGIYGFADSEELAKKTDLEPALELKSEILSVRKVAKGGFIGYSSQYQAQRDMTIGVVPLGYGDGYPKLLTNKGYVLHRGIKRPIVGSICMDQFMIDLTDAEEAKATDEIVLIGSQGDSSITVYELASLIGTIPYDIITSLNSRLERRYV
ncbi:MAG: alanine racemase [Candidatus Kapaibacteriales bacterium]